MRLYVILSALDLYLLVVNYVEEFPSLQSMTMMATIIAIHNNFSIYFYVRDNDNKIGREMKLTATEIVTKWRRRIEFGLNQKPKEIALTFIHIKFVCC